MTTAALPRRSVFMLSTFALMSAVVALWSSWPFNVDDAFILFRYGRHLAQGHGLAWNPGEAPTEGYTNLLFVLWSALLPRDVEPILLFKALGLVSWAGAIALTGAIAFRFLGHLEYAFVAAVFLLASPGLSFWAVAGLETTFFMVLLLGATWLALQNASRTDWYAVGLLFLATLARTEGPAFSLTLLVLRARALRSDAQRWKPWITLVFATAAFFVWRAVYFGHLLPNPVLYKSMLTTAGAGRSVLLPFVETWWPLLLLAMAGAWVERERLWLPVVMMLVGLGVYSTASTDVHGSLTMTFFDRFVLPLTPFVSMLAAAPVAKLLEGRRSSLAVALIAMVMGWMAFNPQVNLRVTGTRAMSQVKNVRPALESLAAFLSAARPATYRLAIGDVGLVGFRFQGPIDDIYGLNEYGYTIGCRGDVTCWAEALLDRAPDGFVFVMNGDEAAHDTERAVLAHPRFAATWKLSQIFRAGTNSWRYVLFEKKSD